MENQSENTKRIAKNTLMLYVRMLFGMLVSLYTSRVVLQALGVEDYGIYNVVGGVVAMLSFLNDSMSGATSRFITYELGRDDLKRLNQVFSTSLIIHIFIALLVFFVAETIGLWFLENKLIIPDHRMISARFVFHLSVISMMIGIIQVPYNAVIISHEKMDVYAYVGILNIFLRLLIVYMLVIGNYDKLIFYAVLQFIVSIIIILIYRIYCFKKYPETHFKFIIKKEYIYPMLNFSGWDLYGNASVMARTQGVNMLINVFFGPMLNAASGIASQVQGAVMGLANNLVTATRPQIVKLYAIGEYGTMIKLFRDSLKLSYMLLALMSIPLMCEMNFILHLWLGTVPEYAVIFGRYTLLFNFFANMSLLLACIIHATGKIKRISFINGSLYLMVIPFSFICYKLGANPEVAYIFNVIAVLFGMLSNAWTVHLYIPEFSFKKYVYNDFMRMIILLIITYYIVLNFIKFMDESFIRFVFTFLISASIILITGYLFLLSKDLKRSLYRQIKMKLKIWN